MIALFAIKNVVNIGLFLANLFLLVCDVWKYVYVFLHLLYRDYLLTWGRAWLILVMALVFYVIPDEILAIQTIIGLKIMMMFAEWFYAKQTVQILK